LETVAATLIVVAEKTESVGTAAVNIDSRRRGSAQNGIRSASVPETRR
jgi:hypothetical protein